MSVRHRGDLAIGVVGGGSWGTTLAHLLARNGNDVLLWVRRKGQATEINKKHTNERYLPGYTLDPRIRATTRLEDIPYRCQAILMAVPSSVLREVAFRVGDHLRGDQILVSATKGLEDETFYRMSEVLQQETCCKKIGALSGPNLAREIMDGQPAATVVASRFDEVVETIDGLLSSPRMRVYGNKDIVGVELVGALKNILAIATGVATGMGLGDNAKAFLLTRGLAEISRLGVAAGADPLTIVGLSGVGDMIATCSSPLSRNHQVGRRLGEGETLPDILDSMVMVAEGVHTARVAHSYAATLGIDMPITRGVFQLLHQGRAAHEVLEDLMGRPSNYEIDGTPIP
jgi:glycerol-3-phosphate dehydrogenase (NAD(P)+)